MIITDISIECLAMICRRIDITDINELWLTGNLSLQYLMRNGGVPKVRIRNIRTQHYHNKRKVELKSILRRYTGATAVRLGDKDNQNQYCGENPSRALSCMKNLVKLRIDCGTYTYFDQSRISKLPRRITHLTLKYCEISEDALVDLPPHLTYLSLPHCDENIYDSASAILPRSITHLNLASNTGFTASGIANLPRSLQHLRMQNAPKYAETNGGITEPFMSFLPHALTSLDMKHNNLLSASNIAALPRNLTSIRMPCLLGGVSVTVQHLPISLTQLRITSGNIHVTNGLGVTDASPPRWPPRLQHLQFAANEHILARSGMLDYLPESLTQLDILCENVFNDSDMLLLPRLLVKLDLYHNTCLTDLGMSNLPPALRCLYLRNCPLVTNVGVRALPSTLDELYFGRNDNVSYDADFPIHLRKLTIKRLTGRGPGTTHTHVLPRSLTTLHLPHETLLTGWDIEHLPRRLTKLNLKSIGKFNHIWLPLLPPNLTKLVLHKNVCELLTSGTGIGCPPSLNFYDQDGDMWGFAAAPLQTTNTSSLKDSCGGRALIGVMSATAITAFIILVVAVAMKIHTFEQLDSYSKIFIFK